MVISLVNNKKTELQFLDVPRKIYKKDPYWACPLDTEIKDIFNPQRNKKLEFGEAVRWILLSEKGELLGRIAAFYDKRRAFKQKPFAGGTGFFECIDNIDAAIILFDTAKKWLQEKGLEAMDGPVNFGENFVHQGLLVDGYMPQGYGMPYNKPYYQKLYEGYGFQSYFEMYSYHLDLAKPLPPRQVQFAKHITKKEQFRFDHFRFKYYEKYLNDIIKIYNNVWSTFHDDYIPLDFDEMKKMMIEAKPVLKEEFIWFMYDGEKPIGLLVTFPDINQILRKLNGKMDLIGKLQFLFTKLTTKITRARLLVAGILPEYQKTGVISGAYIHMIEELRKNGILELESGWVGEYNPTVNKLYELLGADRAKTHITYRFLFDREMPFKRFMMD
jgi:hypothetical protein